MKREDDANLRHHAAPQMLFRLSRRALFLTVEGPRP